MLRQPLFFGLVAKASSFLNTHVTDLRDAMPRQRSLTRTHTCDLRDAMPRQMSLYTYLTP